jgi:hypothetical protein
VSETPEVPELVNVPQDLALTSDADLATLLEAAVAEFDSVNAGPVTPESVQHAMRLDTDITRLRSETAVRAERARVEAQRQQDQLAEQMRSLATRVKGPEGEGETAGTEGGTAATAAPAIDLEAVAAAAARGVAIAMAETNRKGSGIQVADRITNSLAAAAQHAPAPQVPGKRLSITASVDIPGIEAGTSLDLDTLVSSVQRRAKVMPVSRTGDTSGGAIVATVQQQFEHTVDDRTSPAQMDELVAFLTSQDKQQALVAGGGWCAPSELTYNFFNIATSDGLIDLPTVGISRGGIKYPVSPSMADVQLAPFVSGFSNASVPWLWTETDDQATVTGTPNKPCYRIPCPSFSETRLECYGVCVTAGNLTDDAYPELTANTLRLVMTAHAHAMNTRLIATMVGLSSAAVTGGELTGAAAASDPVTQILGATELAAIDYREKYAMAGDSVLEVVFPRWVKAVIRAALRHRVAVTEFDETDAEIVALFGGLNVRAQFVADWQVRGAGQFGTATAMTAWPVTLDFMLYAAGTFIKGNGLTLDLGVVRDSTLNAENDFTAAWSEECHLVARVGHESKIYRVGFNVGNITLGTAPAGGIAL